MKCKHCDHDPDEDMVFVCCADSPNLGYAYNLYQCSNCDTLCKQDVWKGAGEIWITTDNKIDVIGRRVSL